MKINQDCDLKVTVLGNRCINITTVHDNKFKRRLFVGYTEQQAKDKFKELLKKGEL